MHKKIAILLVVVFAMNCLTGCSREQAPEENISTEAAIAEEATFSIKETLQLDGCTLVIDTDVLVPDLTALEEITLVFDEAALDSMVKDLVHSRYPDLEEGTMDGCRSWSVATPEQLLFSFDCDDDGFDAGWTGYLDVSRNLNGQDMDEDVLAPFIPHYLTPHIPDKLEMSSAEAGEIIAAFLEQYSCFTYEPWNVVGVNCRDVPDSSGYYQARMQPQYNGLPVYVDKVPMVGACLSANGIFEFQGILALKEQSRQSAEVNFSLEEAVAQFLVDFSDSPRGHHASVERIYLGYIAESHYDETRVLSPAWFIDYSYQETHINTGEEMTLYSTYMYRLDNGSLYTY